MSEHTAKLLAEEVARQKRNLVEKLMSLEVPVSYAETFNTLIPKISDIKRNDSYIYGERTLLSTVDSLTISGLPTEPTQISLACERALVAELKSVRTYIYVALSALDISASEVVVGVLSPDTGQMQTTAAISVEALITVEEIDGTYSITISFADENENLSVPFAFAPYNTYSWAIF